MFLRPPFLPIFSSSTASLMPPTASPTPLNGIRLNPCATPLWGGPSGHLADPIPNTDTDRHTQTHTDAKTQTQTQRHRPTHPHQVLCSTSSTILRLWFGALIDGYLLFGTVDGGDLLLVRVGPVDLSVGFSAVCHNIANNTTMCHPMQFMEGGMSKECRPRSDWKP